MNSLSQLLRGSWSLDPQMVHVIGDLMTRFATGQKVSGFLLQKSANDSVPPFLKSYAISQRLVFLPSEKEIPKNSTAVILVSGLMVKHGLQGSPGMADIGNSIQLANNSPNVRAVLYYVDSEGGTTDGTQGLADAVRRFKKPSLAYVDGQMTGSAYVAFSGARVVMACDGTAKVGGIGTIITFADYRGVFEKLGVVFHDILSSLSKDKNKELFDARKGKYDSLKKNQLDPLAEIFIRYVGQNRREATGEKWKTGKTFFAQEALSLGLIDSIGTLDEALKKLKEMA